MAEMAKTPRFTKEEIIRIVKEQNIRFVRLQFTDIFGQCKNVAITESQLEKALANKCMFDGSSIEGFVRIEESDMYLYPDLDSFMIYPWKQEHGKVARLICDVHKTDGAPFEGDPRSILRRILAEAAKMGFTFNVGPECEFFLFQTDDEGYPTTTTIDHGSYFELGPVDRGEDARRDICLTLEDMGFEIEASHHECAPGQHEIDFKYSDAMTAADNLLTFKAAVKSIAARNGLYASFMPKPLPDKSGSGLHVNLSLSQGGRNIFKTAPDEGHCPEAEHFMAGVLDHIREITVFLNPLTNSYARFGAFEAPRYLSWSHQNRSQLIRIPAATGAQSRMELRSPDPSCNPHLAFAMLLQAGLDGIRRELPLCPAVDLNLYDADPGVLEKMPALPENLEEAVSLARSSAFVQSVLPAKTLANYCDVKLEDWKRCREAEDQAAAERKLYFTAI